jgi:hypothetical protein
MQYYDVKRQWPRIRPHLANPKVADVLVRDFNKFTFGRWKEPFLHGMVPHEFESCDWWCGHRGRFPAYWQYVKHSACHWLVNFNLELAQASVADRGWRIVTSDDHSTVWDGAMTLFDLNFLALGVSPTECYRKARRKGTVLRPGVQMPVSFTDHYSVDFPDAVPAP